MDYKKETTRISLVELCTKKFFDLTIFNHLIALNNISPDGNFSKILNALHCIYYDKMKPEFKLWLIENVLLVFGYTPDSVGIKIELPVVPKEEE